MGQFHPRARRLAIANLKGGVGKSTTTMFVAETLAVHHHWRVLVVDLDPQANASFMLLSREGVEKADTDGKTLSHYFLNLNLAKPAPASSFVVKDASDLEELRQRGAHGRVDIMASVPRMWFIELVQDKRHYLAQLDPAAGVKRSLDEGLAPLSADYDLIIFDCPPGFSSLTRAGLLCADAILSPTIADPVSMRSLGDFCELGLGDVMKIRGTVSHFVVVSKYRALAEDDTEIQRLKFYYDVAEPYVRYSVQMTRATERIRLSTRRTYEAKYSGLAHDLRRLTADIANRL